MSVWYVSGFGLESGPSEIVEITSEIAEIVSEGGFSDSNMLSDPAHISERKKIKEKACSQHGCNDEQAH